MKTAIVALVLLLSACAEAKTINGVTYEPYGLINAHEVKDPNVTYSLSTANVVWAIVLSETVVAPVLLCGWQLYEPVGLKNAK